MMRRFAGFTLIELMIALAVFAFLIMIAGPQYSEFMGNMQIRNGAENTLTGVRRAQAEAVRSNTLVQFILDPTPCSGGWQVSKLNDETNAYDVVDSYTYADGACKTTPSTEPSGATKITFNGLGRIVANIDDSDKIKWVEITNTNVPVGNRRNLRVVVDRASSGIKLCDPNPIVASDDARFCPAT